MTFTERRRFDDACEALRLAMETACVPIADLPCAMPLTGYVPYYGEPVSRCLWYLRYVVREARRLNLYPSTAVLEAETQRRHAA